MGALWSKVDPCLYTWSHPVHGLVYVIVYVDDLIVAARGAVATRGVVATRGGGAERLWALLWWCPTDRMWSYGHPDGSGVLKAHARSSLDLIRGWLKN